MRRQKPPRFDGGMISGVKESGTVFIRPRLTPSMRYIATANSSTSSFPSLSISAKCQIALSCLTSSPDFIRVDFACAPISFPETGLRDLKSPLHLSYISSFTIHGTSAVGDPNGSSGLPRSEFAPGLFTGGGLVTGFTGAERVLLGSATFGYNTSLLGANLSGDPNFLAGGGTLIWGETLMLMPPGGENGDMLLFSSSSPDSIFGSLRIIAGMVSDNILSNSWEASSMSSGLGSLQICFPSHRCRNRWRFGKSLAGIPSC
mmetsp:Transcript_8740/g.21542  ORF Transcript_8740/g.21542 Transcript_8740/m.21542 type:complete len:260 (+) Transcript_8740:273-1052(+)